MRYETKEEFIASLKLQYNFDKSYFGWAGTYEIYCKKIKVGFGNLRSGILNYQENMFSSMCKELFGIPIRNLTPVIKKLLAQKFSVSYSNIRKQ